MVDIISGFTIWIAANLITNLVYGMGAMASVATETESAIEPSYGFSLPQSGIDYLMMIVLSLCIGFSEELAMRGYLIPRFEKLLGSTTRSLFASTALFASYHLYQGFEGVVLVFFTGLVFGIAFCWSRRLWPVVIAHACADIWALGTAG
jgi:membrane protease YdiL (CAAX protease family)